jgi:mannose-6-phosphate isomerase-like protein (cupin superfamily)
MTENSHGMRPFKIAIPEGPAKKKVIRLARTDRMIGILQVLKGGGENNLHSHDHFDGFWFVMQGRVRFYGADDVLVGEYGPGEGVLVPRKVPYWFECASEEDLHLLQVESFDVPLRTPQDIAAEV